MGGLGGGVRGAAVAGGGGGGKEEGQLGGAGVAGLRGYLTGRMSAAPLGIRVVVRL